MTASQMSFLCHWKFGKSTNRIAVAAASCIGVTRTVLAYTGFAKTFRCAEARRSSSSNFATFVIFMLPPENININMHYDV